MEHEEKMDTKILHNIHIPYLIFVFYLDCSYAMHLNFKFKK